MTFIEAFAALRMGKICTRRGNIDSYIVLLPRQDYMWQINGVNKQPSINATVYSPSQSDVMASDWIVVE
jgi:hypothetical protein